MSSSTLSRLSLGLLAGTASLAVLTCNAGAAPIGSLHRYDLPPPPATSTRIQDLSGDGSIGVGYVNAPAGTYATSWSSSGAATDLGMSFENVATGISGDGTTIVGTYHGVASYASWTYKNGVVLQLPTLVMNGQSRAEATNNDGTVVVGMSETGAVNWHATMWSGPNWSVVQDLGSLDLTGRSWALDVSGDGKIVVGNASIGGNDHAFFWRDNVMHNLDIGWTESGAEAISTSGSTIVGWSYDGTAHAISFSGVDFSTVAQLGTLGGASFARAVNANGTIIVGTSVVGGVDRAFRYADGSMVDLNTLLSSSGVNMAGIVLRDATAISDNGDYIATIDGSNISSYLVYYHDGVAGLTTGAEQQASVDALSQTRKAIAIQHDAYAGILTGDLDRHDKSSAEIGAFGLVGSAVGGVSGKVGLGHGLSVSAGVLMGSSSFGGATMGSGPMAAASLRYDTGLDIAGFEPFAQVGGSVGLLNAISFTRSYTGGTGLGQTDGSLASLYARLGLTKTFEGGDQVTVSGEIGNRWLSTGAYTEALSPTNPFPATIPVATDRTTVGVAAASWTHPLSNSVDLTIRTAVGAALYQSSNLQAKTIGFGTIAAVGSNPLWVEAGAHLSWNVTEQSSVDLYGTVMSGSGIGTNGHIGGGYRFRF